MKAKVANKSNLALYENSGKQTFVKVKNMPAWEILEDYCAIKFCPKNKNYLTCGPQGFDLFSVGKKPQKNWRKNLSLVCVEGEGGVQFRKTSKNSCNFSSWGFPALAWLPQMKIIISNLVLMCYLIMLRRYFNKR